MAALDTYRDNLCLWCCLAVHRGVRPDRSTQASDCPKTSLDELDHVERHLNQGNPVSDWLGIRVYEPVREAGGEAIWRLGRNPPANLKNILTIGVYEGHAFVIKDVAKLAKTYACAHAGSLHKIL